MSDEEKKAIDKINNSYDYNTGWVEADASDWRIVTDLIEKQSKEIEELNSDLEVFKRALTDIEVVYNKNYTSNDKIKAKIEYYKKIDNAVGVRILESLLEKE